MNRMIVCFFLFSFLSYGNETHLVPRSFPVALNFEETLEMFQESYPSYEEQPYIVAKMIGMKVRSILIEGYRIHLNERFSKEGADKLKQNLLSETENKVLKELRFLALLESFVSNKDPAYSVKLNLPSSYNLFVLNATLITFSPYILVTYLLIYHPSLFTLEAEGVYTAATIIAFIFGAISSGVLRDQAPYLKKKPRTELDLSFMVKILSSIVSSSTHQKIRQAFESGLGDLPFVDGEQELTQGIQDALVTWSTDAQINCDLKKFLSE